VARLTNRDPVRDFNFGVPLVGSEPQEFDLSLSQFVLRFENGEKEAVVVMVKGLGNHKGQG
jgi:hypothetical protein